MNIVTPSADTMQRIATIVDGFKPILDAIKPLEGQNEYTNILNKIQETISWIHIGLATYENIQTGNVVGALATIETAAIPASTTT